ncbi:MAG: MFS transporter [Kofleriaceae bacterium]
MAAARRLVSVTILLYAVAVLDELASGVPTAGAPDIERTFGLAHSHTALVVFVVPGIVALVIEPIVFLLSDRFPRRWFIAGGLAGMAAAALLSAIAPTPEILVVAFSLWFISSGAATALSQATLVDRDPEHRARTLTRWSLCSLVGDLAAPAILAVLAALGFEWRVAFVIVGIVVGVWAVAVALRPFPPAAVLAEEAAPSMWQSVRTALGDRVLLLWLFGCALCDMLDEILVVFASLHVRDELGGGPTWQAVILGASMGGGALGLVVLERLLTRYSERTLLVATGLGCAVAYLAWLAAPTLWLSALLMLPVGAAATALYPLAAALAYARAPGRSGMVLAAGHLFTPLGLALPFAIGLVADAAGTQVALLLLVAQPLGMALLARIDRSGVRSSSP